MYYPPTQLLNIRRGGRRLVKSLTPASFMIRCRVCQDNIERAGASYANHRHRGTRPYEQRAARRPSPHKTRWKGLSPRRTIASMTSLDPENVAPHHKATAVLVPSGDSAAASKS